MCYTPMWGRDADTKTVTEQRGPAPGYVLVYHDPDGTGTEKYDGGAGAVYDGHVVPSLSSSLTTMSATKKMQK